MATSGKYEAEVELKGSADKHFKRWKSDNHFFPDTIGHHIQNVTVHEGDWHSHGSVKVWNYTCDGKQEVLKERREIDDAKKTLIFDGLEGHAMEDFKKYHVTFVFYPKSDDGCVCKITIIWEKRNENVPEPIRYLDFVKKIVADMDNHILKAA